jgi:hypothetical protein
MQAEAEQVKASPAHQQPAYGFVAQRCQTADDPTRTDDTASSIDIAETRLSAICYDLMAFYRNSMEAEMLSAFRVVSDPDPRLLIGEQGVVSLDAERGLYLLSIQGSKPGTVTIATASEARLVDHIICHLALGGGKRPSMTDVGSISNLVGRSLADVERGLILATLRQCHFNRTETAKTLGISV